MFFEADMRLTAVLCRGKRTYRDKLEYLRKYFWRHVVSNMEVDRLRVPDRALRNKKFPFSQAEDMFTSTRYEDALAEEIEIGVSPEEAGRISQERLSRLDHWSPYRHDPRYHPKEQEPTLMFSAKRRFTKGLDQASLLTNTVVIEGSPPMMKNLNETLDKFILNNTGISGTTCTSDHGDKWPELLRSAVERAIMHAHVWHTEETKLPRRFCPELPIWKHKTEFGIHPQNATRFLFHNLFRVLDLQVPQLLNHLGIVTDSADSSVSTLPKRWTTRDRLLETHFFYGDPGRRVGFAENQDLVIYGTEPIRPFHTLDAGFILDLNATHPPPLSVLGPMSPLIDLESTHYYLDESSDGWVKNAHRPYPHPHLITVNHSLPSVWSDFLEPEAEPITAEQRQAIALMHCFAAAVAHAHHLGYLSGTDLPAPICLDAVCSDGVWFDFVSLQLNTLRVPDTSQSNYLSDGVRNVAWVDGSRRLFDKIVPRRSRLRNTKYRDLDMHVFSRLATSYLWGLVGHRMNMQHPQADAKEAMASG
ncbi:39S ribosomal protein L37 mitochondrial [Fasciola hepatica]|uniref:Large ribosomal subunit protein mL37 n=1 Tax=Fasciola hepatica TaxID=6192 RepID=A0A4E0RU22_FASHE|nr:39S ribosomal protein L37 mitochondrial [Fasciola hepatica]